MKTPPNILFIAYNFPPMSGPGVFRSFHFVRHLKQFGYSPVVLTISEKDIAENKLKTDPQLLEKIPRGTEIIRTPTWEIRGIKRALMKLKVNRLLWFFAFPLVWEIPALWPFASYKRALQIIAEKQIPLVYTSSGPFSAMLLAYLLKRKTGIKWVADIRDPYTDGYMWQWPGKLHWYFSKAIERFLLRRADQVIVNTPEVMKLYEKRNLVAKEKLMVLTNGF